MSSDKMIMGSAMNHGGLNQVDMMRPDPRLDESACELISYSEQVIIGEMRDMAPGIPN